MHDAFKCWLYYFVLRIFYNIINFISGLLAECPSYLKAEHSK